MRYEHFWRSLTDFLFVFPVHDVLFRRLCYDFFRVPRDFGWVGVGRLAFHGMKLDNLAVVRIIITR